MFSFTDKTKMQMVVVLLLVVNAATAIAIVYSVFQHRQHFSLLDKEYEAVVGLEEDWGRLLLERSTYAAPDRIERLAAKRLLMKMPDKDEIKIIKNKGH